MPSRAHRVRLHRAERRRAHESGHGPQVSRRRLPQARPSRDRRHGGRREGAVDSAVHRQESRRHLRHVVRRLHVGDGVAAPSRRLRGRVGVVAADRLAQLRHDLHRALHVDSAGEHGRLRQGLGDDVREQPARAADALLRHGRQQRASVEHDAARSRRCSAPARASRCRSGRTRGTRGSIRSG